MPLLVKLLVQRLALGLLLLWAASVLIFIGTEILPGDVARTILGQGATEQAVANLRAELGLDRPAVVRYLEWLGNVVQGDFGVALSNKREIGPALAQRLGNTLFLAGVTAAIAVPLALALGIIAVFFRDRWPDKMISGLSLSTISLPEFLVAYVLIFVFAVQLGWVRPVSNIHSGMTLLERIAAVLLPAATLTLVIVAHMMRMTRAAILNVMQAAYIETAELKGLPRITVIARHAFPNAVAPVINVIVLNLAYLVVGVVVIEVVFVYPGIGQYLVDHVAKRDVPVVQACGLIFAGLYIGLNLLADIVAILSNPRLRHPR